MRAGLRITSVALAAMLAPVLAGCGDDGTGPEDGGRVEAKMTDAPAEPSAAVAPATSSGFRPAVAGSYSGSFTGNAKVAISADGETWIDLGDAQSVSLSLQSTGDTTSVHGNARVPFGTYAYVRLELADANAHVDAGATIGTISLDAAIDVTVGTGGSVVIEKQVQPFEVRAGTRTTIIFDINSEAWMTEENAEDEQVDEQEVEESTEARTRQTEEVESAA
ncbi:MAG TPA: DUF4382 domain-containing protein [Longimicrobiales bacterium]